MSKIDKIILKVSTIILLISVFCYPSEACSILGFLLLLAYFIFLFFHFLVFYPVFVIGVVSSDLVEDLLISSEKSVIVHGFLTLLLMIVLGFVCYIVIPIIGIMLITNSFDLVSATNIFFDFFSSN